MIADSWSKTKCPRCSGDVMAMGGSQARDGKHRLYYYSCLICEIRITIRSKI